MKFTRLIYPVVALLGCFLLNPTVETIDRTDSDILMPALNINLIKDAEARGGRGRGGARARPARTPNRSVNRRSNNVNVNRNVNVNVDHRHYGGRGAAFVAGAAVATLAIGTWVNTLPAGCTTVVTAGVTYRNCGGTYYQRSYQGADVVYVVVEAP